MVDRERVTRLLDRVSQDVRTLRLQHGRREALVSDDTALAAVKYHFITAIEGCARVAQHLIASEGWPVADDNADALRTLAAEGVITDASGETLAKAVGFRNVLVHQYAVVDDNQVVGNLDRLDDLSDFVSQVATWLTSR